MKENQRLQKLLKDHFNGQPWLDVQLLGSLQGLSAQDAAKNIHGLNAVWQIIHHITCWRETLLERILGKDVPSPPDNYFISLKDTSAAAWQQALSRLEASQQALLTYLDNELTNADEKPGQSNYTCYELLQGVLQHDAYHLGQIVLIRKMLDKS